MFLSGYCEIVLMGLLQEFVVVCCFLEQEKLYVSSRGGDSNASSVHVVSWCGLLIVEMEKLGGYIYMSHSS